MSDALDGLFTFFASHHAIRAEKVMQASGLAALLVPGPKELSPNCGVALRFRHSQLDAALAVLEEKRVQVDSVHRYRPRTDEMGTVEHAGVRTGRLWRRTGA
jgi:hypothetical protein